MGPHWSDVRQAYVEPILQSLEESGAANFEVALVVFGAAAPWSVCPLQRSGWTTDLGLYRQWLSGVQHYGGGRLQSAFAGVSAVRAWLVACDIRLQ